MYFKHTKRPGFWLGFIDFFTAGLFFLVYMPLGGLLETALLAAAVTNCFLHHYPKTTILGRKPGQIYLKCH